MEHARAGIILGIAGGTGSGKSWLAGFLRQELGTRAIVVSQDWYYKDRSGVGKAAKRALNFDHPRAFDTPLLVAHLDALAQGNAVEAPCYDYDTHARAARTRRLEPAPLIVLEGILVLHSAAVRRRLDHSVFVETPADVRLIRRLRRDAAERAIATDETLRLYETFARPMHERFVQPSAARAECVWRALEDTRFPRKFVTRARRW
jgi:uridine kinase